MFDYRTDFIIKPGTNVDLSKIDPDFTGAIKTKEEAKKRLKQNLKRINELQELLYAEDKRSILLCFQAMDAAGKDGAIKSIGGAMNPQGHHMVSFKKPSKLELRHDFLWRVHNEAPVIGEVKFFNRSHYEDVLVVRVDNLVPEKVWAKRYDQINHFEEVLADSGTHILKFFLHISKDEQLSRFKDRLDNPGKHWKISESDYTSRAQWDDYKKAYEDALSKCSTDYAPWFVIPSNKKWFRNLALSEILVSYMEDLKMKFPPPTVDADKIRKQYFPDSVGSQNAKNTPKP
jgi:PPK2 family polyphosphate:nucleotide phosphotransferase